MRSMYSNYYYSWTFLLILVIVAKCTDGKGLHRQKRNLIQLARMIDCKESEHIFTDYNGYGCWCGIGGTATPLDATDRCCQTHDHCYEHLHSKEGPCLAIQTYTALYLRFNCDNCADMSAYNHWWFKFLRTSPECRRRLCECDSALVNCLRSNEETFNPSYRYYYKRITACDSLQPWVRILPNDHRQQDVGLPTPTNIRYDDVSNSILRPDQLQGRIGIPRTDQLGHQANDVRMNIINIINRKNVAENNGENKLK